MKRYLKILTPINVFQNHDLQSPIIDTFQPDQLIHYNREKRRDGKNWMEVYIGEDGIGYIPKERDTFFKCEFVKLNDQLAEGFHIDFKTEEFNSPYTIFHPAGTLGINEDKEKITFKSVEDASEGKEIAAEVEFLTKHAMVEPIFFRKNEEFYVTHEIFGKNFIFKEVNDLNGRQGYILKKSNCSNREDAWVAPVGILIAIVVILGIIIAILQTGWLVISGLMIIPAIIVAVVVIVVIQIVLSILKGIFNMIYKRF